MKKSIIIIAAIFMTAFTTNVMAQATATNSAGGEIVGQIGITKGIELQFGKMAVLASTGGTCKITTAGVRSSTSGVTVNTASTFSNATFDVTGLASAGYNISMASPIVVVNGTDQMTIDQLKLITTFSGTERDATATSSQLNGSGQDVITLGGTLNVGAAQPTGIYAGDFQVTVIYN